MTITTILQQVEAVQLPFAKEIVVVDDFSIEGTREILRNFENNGVKNLRLSITTKIRGRALH